MGRGLAAHEMTHRSVRLWLVPSIDLKEARTWGPLGRTSWKQKRQERELVAESSLGGGEAVGDWTGHYRDKS